MTGDQLGPRRVPAPPSSAPNRDRLLRQKRRRPVRAAVAWRLVAMFATDPDGHMVAATPRSRAVVRVSERLFGVPTGTFRAAVAELHTERIP